MTSEGCTSYRNVVEKAFLPACAFNHYGHEWALSGDNTIHSVATDKSKGLAYSASATLLRCSYTMRFLIWIGR